MIVRDLGQMAYVECVDIQTALLEQVVEGEAENTLLFVEHPPVLTLGADFHEENLPLPRKEYEMRGIEVTATNRGGDVSFHGPGQLVIYPIFSLDVVGRDLHRWMRGLEETMLLTLNRFGITGRRFPPHTGAWVDDKKVAAIGVKVRRWVSMHGIALNCDNDLQVFETFVPCGIRDYGVTSLSAVLGRPVTVGDAKPAVEAAFRDVFPSA